MEATKRCSICNVDKAVYNFNKKASAADGYDNRCKPCKVEYNRNWVNDNREYVRERERNRRVNNPNHRISINMHRRLNHILHRGIYSARTEQIIGLNKPTYLEWLSYNFENEMTWANYGQLWHIDLVILASAYDLTNEQELLSCFNWKNLRPCLKKDNAAKYNFMCQFTIANQSIRVLKFIRKMRQIRIEHFLRNIE